MTSPSNTLKSTNYKTASSCVWLQVSTLENNEELYCCREHVCIVKAPRSHSNLTVLQSQLLTIHTRGINSSWKQAVPRSST
ncbi:hypothetical protein Bpfe_011065 [Biomphalaria pfeifferi]|uniref:Uncharacterized protein n=1 Tax=Biomphalaria pfeifferi TaxID=112525 RepID=A0AAD8BTP8_BIOPF|nr:hypothetical protein Bpfe_011065 [Biomphalaria pfeifferi]